MGKLGSLSYSDYNRARKKFLNSHDFWRISHIAEHPYLTVRRIINSRSIKTVLDVGANDRNFETFLLQKNTKIEYKSLDNDKTLQHDYYSFEQVNTKFDLITMFAVVEHIQPKEFIDNVLPRISKILKEKGVLVIYTNNIYHPLGVRMDLDHEVGYGLRELYSICINQGYSIISASRNGGARRPFKWFYEILIRTILRPFKIDYATSILMIFEKGKSNV